LTLRSTKKKQEIQEVSQKIDLILNSTPAKQTNTNPVEKDMLYLYHVHRNSLNSMNGIIPQYQKILVELNAMLTTFQKLVPVATPANPEALAELISYLKILQSCSEKI